MSDFLDKVRQDLQNGKGKNRSTLKVRDNVVAPVQTNTDTPLVDPSSIKGGQQKVNIAHLIDQRNEARTLGVPDTTPDSYVTGDLQNELVPLTDNKMVKRTDLAKLIDAGKFIGVKITEDNIKSLDSQKFGELASFVNDVTGKKNTAIKTGLEGLQEKGNTDAVRERIATGESYIKGLEDQLHRGEITQEDYDNQLSEGQKANILGYVPGTQSNPTEQVKNRLYIEQVLKPRLDKLGVPVEQYFDDINAMKQSLNLRHDLDFVLGEPGQSFFDRWSKEDSYKYKPLSKEELDSKLDKSAIINNLAEKIKNEKNDTRETSPFWSWNSLNAVPRGIFGVAKGMIQSGLNLVDPKMMQVGSSLNPLYFLTLGNIMDKTLSEPTQDKISKYLQEKRKDIGNFEIPYLTQRDEKYKPGGKWEQALEGTGSTLGFLLSAWLLKKLPIKMSEENIIGITGAMSEAGQLATDTYEKTNGDPNAVFSSFVAGLGLGATEKYGLGEFWNDLDKVTQGGMKNFLKNYLKSTIKESSEEMLQEFTQTSGEALTDRALTGANRDPLSEGVKAGELALYSTLLTQGAMSPFGYHNYNQLSKQQNSTSENKDTESPEATEKPNLSAVVPTVLSPEETRDAIEHVDNLKSKKKEQAVKDTDAEIRSKAIDNLINQQNPDGKKKKKVKVNLSTDDINAEVERLREEQSKSFNNVVPIKADVEQVSSTPVQETTPEPVQADVTSHTVETYNKKIQEISQKLADAGLEAESKTVGDRTIEELPKDPIKTLSLIEKGADRIIQSKGKQIKETKPVTKLPKPAVLPPIDDKTIDKDRPNITTDNLPQVDIADEKTTLADYNEKYYQVLQDVYDYQNKQDAKIEELKPLLKGLRGQEKKDIQAEIDRLKQNKLDVENELYEAQYNKFDKARAGLIAEANKRGLELNGEDEENNFLDEIALMYSDSRESTEINWTKSLKQIFDETVDRYKRSVEEEKKPKVKTIHEQIDDNFNSAVKEGVITERVIKDYDLNVNKVEHIPFLASHYAVLQYAVDTGKNPNGSKVGKLQREETAKENGMLLEVFKLFGSDELLKQVAEEYKQSELLREIETKNKKKANEQPKIETDADLETSVKATATKTRTVKTQAKTVKGRRGKSKVIENIDDAIDDIDNLLSEHYDATGETEKEITENGSLMPGKKLKKATDSYSKALAKELGWEHDTNKKGKTVYSDPNLAPIGGETTIILWKPNSEYGVYISLDYDRDGRGEGGSDEKLVARKNSMWRLTTKKDKYTGLSNQWKSFKDFIDIKGFAEEIKDLLSYEENDVVSDFQKQLKENTEKAKEKLNYKSDNQLPNVYARNQAVGLLTGGSVEKVEQSGYEFIFGELENGSNLYYDLVGMVTGAKADELIGSGVTIKKVSSRSSDKPVTKTKKKLLDIDSSIDDVAKAFHKSITNKLSAGLDPEQLALGLKLVGLYTQKGFYRFKEIAEDIYGRYGKEFFEDIFPSLKTSYANSFMGDTREAQKQYTNIYEVNDLELETLIADFEGENNYTDIDKEKQLNSDKENTDNESERPNNQVSNESGTGTDNSGLVGDVQTDVESGNGRGRKGKLRGVRKGQNGIGVDETGQRGDEDNGNGENGQSERDGEGMESISGRDSELETQKNVKAKGGNYVITSNAEITGTKFDARQRATDNISAIRLLKELLVNHKKATKQEQEILVKYVGWGGIPEIFDESNESYAKERASLKLLVTDFEYSNMRSSVLNAHYTHPVVINFMWDLAKQLGFNGGRVLEPSMGTGHFFGLMPLDIMDNSNLYGVELDAVTGQIARQLYQDAKIDIMGYEKTTYPDGFFDLAISNVPFGDYKVFDPSIDGEFKKRIHNYFFAKTIKQLRDGGLMLFVTSKGTMDSKENSIRNLLENKGEVLGVVRLPGTAFKSNANTEVVTDIIVFRKTDKPNYQYSNSISNTFGSKAENEDGTTSNVFVNDFIFNNPAFVVGELGIKTGRFGKEYTVNYDGDINSLEDDLGSKKELFPKGIYEDTDNKIPEAQEIPEEEKERLKNYEDGEFFVEGAKVFRKVNGRAIEIEFFDKTDKNGKIRSYGVNKRAKVIAQIQIIQLARKVLEQQMISSDDKLYKSDMAGLNVAYDKYVKDYGYLNSTGNRKVLYSEEYGDDPRRTFLLSLENYDDETKKATKSDRFSKRTIFPEKQDFNIEKIEDAMIVSLNTKGKLDVDDIARLMKSSTEDVVKDLVDTDQIYLDGDNWVLSADYLSGNVRAKLFEAEQKVKQGDERYERNIQALEKVIPEDIPSEKINVQMGVNWLPTEMYVEFVNETLNLPKGSVSIRYSQAEGKWKVEKITKGVVSTKENTDDYGLPGHRTGIDLLKYALNNEAVSVKVKDGDGNTYVDKTLSMQANIQVEKIRNRFSKWVFEGDEREKKVTKKYNESFNNIVAKTYNGQHLQLPYLNAVTKVRLFDHIKDAVWRILQDRDVILAHQVGLGKTWSMSIGAMELKRLGLANKPMHVVKNSMVKQYTNEFMSLYPNAKILTIYPEDITKNNREVFLNRIANNNWDSVIVPYTVFESLKLSPAVEIEFAEEQLNDLRELLAEQEQEDKDAGFRKKSHSVKQTEAIIKRLSEKLEALKEKSQLNAGKSVGFEMLGIDQLLVDEAHNFKNLFISTNKNFKGFSNTNAQRSYDMNLKIRQMRNMTGKGVVFATGTPISNSMAEMYNMLRYVAPYVLEEAGIKHFNEFISQYANVSTEPELNFLGTGVKAVSRLRNFINLPEIMSRFRQVADIQDRSTLKNPPKVPVVKGGDMTAISSNTNEHQARYLSELDSRFEAVKDPKNDPRVDNPLKIMTDGKKASTDLRLVGINEDVADSKINNSVKHTFDVWERSKKEKGTQIVFLDYGVPKSSSERLKELSAYEDILKTFQSYVDLGLEEQTEAIEKFRAKIEKAEAEGKEYNDYTELWKAKIVTDTFDQSGDVETAIVDTQATIYDLRDGGTFDLYNDIKQKLMDRGVPEKEIAFVNDAKSNVALQKLYEKVKKGQVRIMLGTSKKLGEGVNVQDKLKAIHILTPPWRPSDVEQMVGRIVRSGNTNSEVELYNYLQKRSLDAYIWETLKNKSTFIGQVMRGDKGIREMEDINEQTLTYEEFAVMSSDNEDLKNRMYLMRDLTKLEMERESFERRKRSVEYDKKTLPEKIENDRKILKELKDSYVPESEITGKLDITIDGERFVSGELEKPEYKAKIETARTTIKELNKKQKDEALSKKEETELYDAEKVIAEHNRLKALPGTSVLAGEKLIKVVKSNYDKDFKRNVEVGKLLKHTILARIYAHAESLKEMAILYVVRNNHQLLSKDINSTSLFVEVDEKGIAISKDSDPTGLIVTIKNSIKDQSRNIDIFERSIVENERRLASIKDTNIEEYPNEKEYQEKVQQLNELNAKLSTDNKNTAEKEEPETETGEDGEPVIREQLPTNALGNPVNEAYLRVIATKLKQSFPGYTNDDVRFMRGKEFISRLTESEGKYYQNSDSVPLGYVGTDGKIYINVDKAGKDTPIHEFSHIYWHWAENSAPAVWQRAVQLVEENPEVLQEIANLYDYDLDNKQQRRQAIHEVLATGTGVAGAIKVEKSIPAERTELFQKVRNLFDAVIRKVKQFFNIADKTEFSKLDGNSTLADFFNAISSDILKGKAIADIKPGEVNKVTLYSYESKGTAKNTSVKNTNAQFQVSAPTGQELKKLIKELKQKAVRPASMNNIAEPEKKWITKKWDEWFTSAGTLGEDVFKLANKMNFAMNSQLKAVEYTVRDLRNAVYKDYGKRPDLNIIQAIDGYIKGDTSFAQYLTPDVLKLSDKMRDNIDLMSIELAKSGAVKEDMAKKILKNINSYTHRSYRVHDEPKEYRQKFIEIDKKLLSGKPLTEEEQTLREVELRARDYIETSYMLMGRELSETELDKKISDILQHDKAQFLNSGQLGKKNLGILKHREDVPPEIRDLLGEYKDPLVNYTKSIAKMVNLIEKHKFLTELRDSGIDKFVFSTPPNKSYVRIAETEDKLLFPLNGYFVHQDLKEAIETHFAVEDMPDLLRHYHKINGVVKYSKTALAWVTTMRNIISNIPMMSANGYWRANHIKDPVMNTINRTFGDKELARAKYVEYMKYGIVEDSAIAGEMRAIIKDAGMSQSADALIQNRIERITSGIKKGIEFPGVIYTGIDDFFKIYAFENEVQRYKKAYPNKSDEEIKTIAGEIIRNVLPTYSMIGKLGKTSRRFPLFGTFVSFPAEIIRNSYNIVEQGLKEISQEETRKIGFSRLASAMATVSSTAVASYISALVFGYNDDDEKKQRQFLADWNKNSQLIYMGKKEDGQIRFIDISFTDPYSYIKKGITALWSGDNLIDKGIGSLVEFGTPFLGEEILAGKIMDVLRNKSAQSGKTIYNEDAPAGDKLKDISLHFWDAFEPGTLLQIRRIVYGAMNRTAPSGRVYDLEDELIALSGFRVTKVDVAQSMSFRVYDMMKELQNIKRIYSEVETQRGDVTKEEKQKAFEKANGLYQEWQDRLRNLVLDGKVLGVDERDITILLKDTGLSKKIQESIKSGTKLQLDPKEYSLKELAVMQTHFKEKIDTLKTKTANPDNEREIQRLQYQVNDIDLKKQEQIKKISYDHAESTLKSGLTTAINSQDEEDFNNNIIYLKELLKDARTPEDTKEDLQIFWEDGYKEYLTEKIEDIRFKIDEKELSAEQGNSMIDFIKKMYSENRYRKNAK